MEHITHHKFSLFRTEADIHRHSSIVNSCFEFIETFDTLDEARLAQKDYEENTIILPSY